jgi:predicted nuclease of predicted toxin-antitoxin system
VKILLDECIDRRLARDLTGHEVTTVQKCGWSGIENGELLALAEKTFDALITVDRKLGAQQDLTNFKIAVVLIRARSNRLKHLRLVLRELLVVLSGARMGALTTVGEV